MSLPIDFAGSLWFMPVAQWEWETLPPPPADLDGSAPAAPADAPASQPRLVFKGYANATAFHWFAADGALSRPWVGARESASERRPQESEPRRWPEPPAVTPGADVGTTQGADAGTPGNR